MTENNPAANDQALPTRRARRAAQNRDLSGAPDGAERSTSQTGGVREPGNSGQAAGEQNDTLPSRRRARAELRSWGSVPAGEASESASGSSPAPAPGAVLEESAPDEGNDGGEPVPAPVADEAADRPEPLTEPDALTEPGAVPEPEALTEPDAVPGRNTAPGPETERDFERAADDEPEHAPEAGTAPDVGQAPGPEHAPEVESAPEAEPASDSGPAREPESETEPVSAPANTVHAAPAAAPEHGVHPAPEPLPEPGGGADGQPLAVALPELPAAPPAGPQQEMEITDREAAETPAGPPAGLPLEPAHMPVDLRERTRAAVRGEPNGVRRATFLDTQTAKIPAARGFRGFLASLGIRIAPSARELEERRDTRIVSQHWPGPRTISVVNGKGGANKTPTTVMLAAIFARNGGGPVLAWDNNETRGTLGWRTEQAQHDATVMDLLPETGLLQSPAAQSAMLAKFVHHQTDDKYDVLRSNPNVLASEQKVTKADFDALHSVASKYFRLNVVDSGNDESAERWLRMIDHTDQLVIATTTVEEHAEAGALLLEALQERGGKYAELARGAVVIVSQADRNGTEAQARRVAEAFKVLARAAVTIPYDPALVKGQIRYASLRPATQRAWLRAAAAVAGGL
ncbi:AAA family ATPase [Arthrobacter koreensis]|uniref:AAA family ATPase n=1 Tax=Arthrobacter koreensis TaxID=199136 RepID=UPI00159EE8AC|nr:AAA family ATPase [Arthrobacter koreensis]